MAVNVRYLTISRIAFELITAMTAEDNMRFNKTLFSCFRQLENGEAIQYEETDNAIMNIALREAVSELENGFVTYKRRASGGKKDEGAKEDQRAGIGTPMVDHSTTEEKKDLLDISERIGKRKAFLPPAVEEVAAYCQERGNGISAEQFVNYYEARGWELKPGQKMKDWRAAVRTWETNRKGWNDELRGVDKGNRVPGQRELYGL